MRCGDILHDFFDMNLQLMVRRITVRILQVAMFENNSAVTAWEFSQDLGNLGINLGFREFSKQSWEFWYIQEIS